jgi:hypothetical protein
MFENVFIILEILVEEGWQKMKYKKSEINQGPHMVTHMPIIPVNGRLGQEYLEFESSLGYKERP